MFLLNQTTHRQVVRYHAQFGHLYTPNLIARLPSERGGFYLRTNKLGFRSDWEFQRSQKHRPRILFFGDSYTAGDGCDNHERFAELVGTSLDAEIYNYGLSGSGTDQQLLIFEEYGQEVDADLIVLAVMIENIERIQVGYRTAIDRTSAQPVLVAKPYFTLLENNTLQLHHVPVPKERPPAKNSSDSVYQQSFREKHPLLNKALRFYRAHPQLQNLLEGPLAGMRSQALRLSGYQLYPEYQDDKHPAWNLMQAIIQRFCNAAESIPVLIVPLPPFPYYYYELQPKYQPLFNRLHDPDNGVYVTNITRSLLTHPRAERRHYRFQYDTHFSPQGHRAVARHLTDEIVRLKLLPRQKALGIHLPQRRAEPESGYILGISCFYHNSAAALIKDGKIIAAAEEERFSRRKNDRRFPHLAINYCLEQAGIHQQSLQAIAYYDNAALTFERLLHSLAVVGEQAEQAWLRILPSWLQYKLHPAPLIRQALHYPSNLGPILQNAHHRSHAASAFYPAPFEQAAILTIDGVGEWATATMAVGRDNEITLLKEMHFPHSLGLLYSAFTQFTGFKVNSGEYKMMGLAPYGEPRYVDAILENIVDLKDDGSIELNLDYFSFLSEPTMTSAKFAELFDGPARAPDAWISQRERDLARSVQVVVEEAILRMARHLHNLTGERNLCLSGGVVLNCVANGRLLREGPFEDIWIQPAAGDAGSALGAALDVWHSYFQQPRKIGPDERSMQAGSLLGPQFSTDEIRAFLDTEGCRYHQLAGQQRAEKAAELLQQGKVLGHFAGRLEFGPRALGARSIIGDPRNQEMQSTLNLKIKYRESFRPFAPAVLADKVSDYFELDRESPYMLIVAPVKKQRQLPFNATGDDLTEIVKQARSDLPAITHIDYSARIQTVYKDDHPPYFKLIDKFREKTGCAVVINTSFNVRGEPIVCTPTEAYHCFMGTEMDALLLGDFLLLKEQQPEWTKPKGHIEEDENLTPPVAVATGDQEKSLQNKLSRLFRQQYLPLAKQLQQQQALHFTTEFRRVASCWRDYEKPSADVFTIPEGLAADKASAEQMAQAIVQSWQAGAATDAFRPLLLKLLKLHTFDPTKIVTDEEVPESVYVMF